MTVCQLASSLLLPQTRDDVLYKPAAALEAALEEQWNGPV